MFWKRKPKAPKVTPGIVKPLPTHRSYIPQPHRFGEPSSSDDGLLSTIVTAEVVESVFDSSSTSDSSSSSDSSPSADFTAGGDSGGGGASGDW
jgi:uncharacterized membrane protein YgcG